MRFVRLCAKCGRGIAVDTVVDREPIWVVGNGQTGKVYAAGEICDGRVVVVERTVALKAAELVGEPDTSDIPESDEEFFRNAKLERKRHA